jgi:hypothetical protein
MNDDDLEAWADEVSDLLARIVDRIDSIDHRLRNLTARVDEWDLEH